MCPLHDKSWRVSSTRWWVVLLPGFHHNVVIMVESRSGITEGMLGQVALWPVFPLCQVWSYAERVPGVCLHGAAVAFTTMLPALWFLWATVSWSLMHLSPFHQLQLGSKIMQTHMHHTSKLTSVDTCSSTHQSNNPNGFRSSKHWFLFHQCSQSNLIQPWLIRGNDIIRKLFWDILLLHRIW